MWRFTCYSLSVFFFLPFLLTNAAQKSEKLRQQIVDFDSAVDSAEDSFPFQNQETSVISSVQRLWGIPDVSTHAWRLFHLSIPPDAFSGTIHYFEAEGTENRPLPKWLTFNKTSGVLEGVPSEDNTGEFYIKIRAVNTKLKESVDDVFSIDVLPFSYFNGFQKNQQCQANEEITVLNLEVDAAVNELSNQQKISSIKNLAGYLGLHYSMVSLLPAEPDISLLSNSVLIAGRGDAKHQKSKESSNFVWQIGCDSRVWLDRMKLLDQVKQDALEGSLSETLQIPVIGWHVSSVSNNARKRREIGGFGAESIETDNDLDEPNSRIIPTMSSPSFSFHPATVESTPLHPHRHHHGESLPPVSHVYKSAAPSISVMPTPTFDPQRPTDLVYSPPVYEMKSRAAPPEDLIAPSPTFPEPASTVAPDLSSSETPDVSSPDIEDNITSSGDHPLSSVSFASTPSLQATTEKIENDTKNFPPSIQHLLPKLALTAGKVFRYKIPNDTFSDLEDDNLQLVVKMEGNPIPANLWVQFNPKTQEIYALPLEDQVSRWNVNVEAIDSGGLSVTNMLELSVQHHKRNRAVTHEIVLHVRVLEPSHFPTVVDWEFFLVEKLAKLNNDTDEVTHITVRSLNATVDPTLFAYTNDSLPTTNQCSTLQLMKLISVLASDAESGSVKPSVNEALHPYLTLSKITWKGIGQCEDKSAPPTSYPKPKDHRPERRNPVDVIKATVGELYVFKVPEDTFYDPEDGYTPNLKLSLLSLDRTPIPRNNWLQFDSKNQEFFGVPSPSDVGRKEYYLVCEDKAGKNANDGLNVIVQPPPEYLFSVEFSMKINTPYLEFMDSPSMQRHFIERLSLLFYDTNTSNIMIKSTAPGSTLITWHNRSLSVGSCPSDDAMVPLRKILLTNDEKLEKRVNEVMGPEFFVTSANVVATGVCLVGNNEGYNPEQTVPVSDEIHPVSASSEYLFTFVIPTVIIIVMLLFSSFLACHLYRRKRTGKMSISDEDERRSFRSKGIPVIFQDELEEKLEEPSNKSPVIMKEERPPLPPPQYQRSLPLPTTALLSDTEDSPYQPPPPFTTSRGDSDRQSRPKPTPTYRMPPPYVPP